jgi:uncharacterized protein DUF4429/putative oligomerization/nucleic acid binding protein
VSRNPEEVLYDGALAFQVRSQEEQARVIAAFEDTVGALVEKIGDILCIDEPDRQLWLRADGQFHGRVIPDDVAEAVSWVPLDNARELTEFFDATELFVGLAEAIEKKSPAIPAASEGAFDDFVQAESWNGAIFPGASVHQQYGEVGSQFTTRARHSMTPGEDSELLAEAEGSGGHIWVWADRLRIKPFGFRGLVTKGFLKGEKDLWLDQISGVQWREPGSLWLGHIQFTLIGGSSDSKLATEDENAVQFAADRRDEFAHVKTVVEQRIRELRLGDRGRTVGPQMPASQPTQRPTEILRELSELREAGVITDSEFEEKKRDLLDRL